jgi:hypothetical protein
MGQGQVAGTGDGQKFRGALDDAEYGCGEDIHGLALYESEGEK